MVNYHYNPGPATKGHVFEWNHGSHQEALAYYAARTFTGGPYDHVVELGMGYGSTPLLVGLCVALGGELHSFDDSAAWTGRFAFNAAHGGANVVTVNRRPDREWDLIGTPLTGVDLTQVGLVFLDHGNGPARALNVRQLAGILGPDAVLLVHDTEPENEGFYGWGDCWDAWSFCRVWDKWWPHCRALSHREENL